MLGQAVEREWEAWRRVEGAGPGVEGVDDGVRARGACVQALEVHASSALEGGDRGPGEVEADRQLAVDLHEPADLVGDWPAGREDQEVDRDTFGQAGGLQALLAGLQGPVVGDPGVPHLGVQRGEGDRGAVHPGRSGRASQDAAPLLPTLETHEGNPGVPDVGDPQGVCGCLARCGREPDCQLAKVHKDQDRHRPGVHGERRPYLHHLGQRSEVREAGTDDALEKLGGGEDPARRARGRHARARLARARRRHFGALFHRGMRREQEER